ncbi:hypothetical protein [Rhodopirellula baltica]|uniref:hypothetical protein n=1 Tax=Rhodopirellula baltica TaxID=265606 RepID=UPI000560A8FB|nr:hypothetical protein [Rhodopirellula baltica]
MFQNIVPVFHVAIASRCMLFEMQVIPADLLQHVAKILCERLVSGVVVGRNDYLAGGQWPHCVLKSHPNF